MDLSVFNQENLFDATYQFFTEQLNVQLKTQSKMPIDLDKFVAKAGIENQKVDAILEQIETTHFVGLLDDQNFAMGNFKAEGKSLDEEQEHLEGEDDDYPGIMIFALDAGNSINTSRSNLSEIARVLNRISKQVPVLAVVRYRQKIALMLAERTAYKQEWRQGEKVGRVTMLKDVEIDNPHAAHQNILEELKIADGLTGVTELYNYWQEKFSLETLNNQFYGDLQEWFYFALKNVELPFISSYVKESEAKKNFLVRLIARTMFCWFIKEKGLIRRELLELENWKGDHFALTHDVGSDGFLDSNSYYRGILQNVFFMSLNQREKSNESDFKWTEYWKSDFNMEWLTDIPYLNGGIFDVLEEDNAKDSIEDDVISIPNYLFYGNEEQAGLNQIFRSYKFTLEENTPFEEDIALDPELLGLMFENLLAEIDPNLKDKTKKSIRKLTGSYYTPRKVIQEMVNESLFLYLYKQFEAQEARDYKEPLRALVYGNELTAEDPFFNATVVNALDEYKVLDPACGSGAFPMGMLQRIVEILKLVDPDNSLWLEQKLQGVDESYREEFKQTLLRHMDDYSRKLGIIRDSIYGIDIQPLAVQITKLRFFISLLIDQDIEQEVTPMPNVETKIVCANTLKNLQPNLFANEAIDQLKKARREYYKPDLTAEERAEVADDIVEVMNKAFPAFSKEITGKKIEGQNKALLRKWFTHATVAAPFFNMDFFFPELIDHGGFDCVIGNPPYGGKKLKKNVCEALGIQSKDPYGAFIARFLASGKKVTPLKDGGVLAYIVSDTFMTIKSHLKLRRQMMDNYIHKMIRVHPDTFRATVNTAVIICERNEYDKEDGEIIRRFDDNHICQMVDMTNISIHEQYDRFIELMHKTEGVRFGDDNGRLQNVSTPEYAIYYYPQNLIKTNSNLPFFVASPKLFALMNDGNDRDRKPETKNTQLAGEEITVRKIPINDQEIELIKLGDIADVKVGLQTGDNDAYLFQKPEARGNYRNIYEYEEYLLTKGDLKRIQHDDDLRLEVIEKGIAKEGTSSDRYFGGRYIVPYDKGGKSDADGGWMPNYYVESQYFINWSEKYAQTLINKELLRSSSTEPYPRNTKYYFLKGISFSDTGVYSPTYRLNFGSVFDQKGSNIIPNTDEYNSLLGVLTTKLVKYIVRNIINHTVSSHVDCQKEIVISVDILSDEIKELVEAVIHKQRKESQYDYASHEQLKIDKLVYEAHGLEPEDIQEVETWYERRYGKLVAAQKENLRKLGKSDDYLELYEEIEVEEV